MTLSETLIHSTIRIICGNGQAASCGTGFFFLFSTDNPDVTIPVIVTNRHVVKGATSGTLLFSLCDDEQHYLPGKTHEYKISNFEQCWQFHPDKNVDLCVMPIAQFYKKYRPNPYNLYMTYISEKDIPSAEEIENFSHIEDITVIGYPDGLWDQKNNLPLVRRGITASSLHYDFNGNSEFVIDAAIFGGSSGSPVFVYNDGYYMSRGGLSLGHRAKLVGINRAVYLHPIHGEITEINPTEVSLGKTAIQMPNGLGIAIHARKLLDFKSILQECR